MVIPNDDDQSFECEIFKDDGGTPPPPTNHLLDGSGNVLAITVGVDQLTNA